MSELKITTQDGEDITNVVRQMYDMAVSSMDYGSGCLSTEELETLYRLALILDAKDAKQVAADLRQMRYGYPRDRTDAAHPFQSDNDEYPHCLVCGYERVYTGLHVA